MRARNGGFIAGVTIVVGIVGLGMADELVAQDLGEDDGSLVGDLALGPLDRVVVSALHVLFGVWLGGDVSYADLSRLR